MSDVPATVNTAAAQAAAPRQAAGRIEVFRAAEARSLGEAGMMHAEPPPAERAPLNAVFAEAVSVGTASRVLFRSPGPAGFSLVYAWFKSHYPLPAHSHNTPCLYYVIAGELALGLQVLKAGDGFFVPANAIYSYTAGAQGVEVLEFRDATEFDFVMRPGALPMWQRAAAICSANLERWKTEPPPSM
jgi:quercetin dioxygenase-like cupin family protein